MVQRLHLRMTHRGAAIGALALFCLTHSALAQSQCPDWIPTFGPQPGVNFAGITAIAAFDDATGPALYAGGSFNSAGTSEALNIAKWDGGAWSALGSGIGDSPGDSVLALAFFDDGSGPALYAGGEFALAGGNAASNIAKWDGTSWSVLGSGVAGGSFFGPEVDALVVFDDGTGPALYVGGDFTSAGGVAANYIAKWNGSEWAALGSGVIGADPLLTSVFALTVFDDGTGLALYVGGKFHAAGGVPAFCIAKWDGTSWSALGNGVSDTVFALTVFDDGTGPALYAGGDFLFADGNISFRVAKWDGSLWSPVSQSGVGFSDRVNSLAVLDDGTGAALYVGGDFAFFFGLGHNAPIPHGIAKWDGAQFSILEGGLTSNTATINPRVFALHIFDDGGGPALYAGGRFDAAGNVGVSDIARWDGAAWSSLGNGLSGPVAALTVFDDGTGPALYAGGGFNSAGGVVTHRLARWDGAAWSPLGSGIGQQGQLGNTIFSQGIDALAVFDDGTVPALYVCGRFTAIGGVPANGVAKWDGAAWSALGTGIDDGSIPSVDTLAAFDDGTGSALYIGGNFALAGSNPANNIARWDGAAWSALGSGLDGRVSALAGIDDGTGPALYAGGSFTSAGGDPASHIAKWDGAAWSPLGSGCDARVFVLTVFDDGAGPALYVGGEFLTAGGIGASHIAKWDGVAWSPVGSGFDQSAFAFTVFDDGAGMALYAGGLFTTAGGVAANGIARWDGASWSGLGSGLPSGAFALMAFDDGTGSDLYAGGSFFSSPTGDSFLARWGGPNGPVCPGDANADGIVDFGDVTTVIGNWLSDGAAGGDANCNSSVDFKDITTILGNWLATCP